MIVRKGIKAEEKSDFIRILLVPWALFKFDLEKSYLPMHGGRKRPHGWPMVISEFLRFVGVNVLQISKLKRHDQ